MMFNFNGLKKHQIPLAILVFITTYIFPPHSFSQSLDSKSVVVSYPIYNYDFSKERFEKPVKKLINIGVLSHRGDAATLNTWSSLTSYLNNNLQKYQFQIIPIKFDLIEQNVKQQSIDFLLVNPGIYVAMEVKHRVSRLVTLNKSGKNELLNVFGGVLFTKKNRSDINRIEDTLDKRFIAVDSISLGGYQMVLRELQQKNISPEHSFSKLSFAGTHDKVVMAIKSGEYDVGTVRTGILEQMAEKGEVRLDDFKIINPQTTLKFPFLISTPLYPEWPLSKLQHTPNKLAQEVAIALLNMTDKNIDVETSNYLGWTVPLDYQEVHELFDELNLPPYEKNKSFTLTDAIFKYWHWLVVANFFILVIVMMSYRIFQLNRKLKDSNYHLLQQHDLVINSVYDGIYGVDLDGNCTFINSAMESLTGWGTEDMIGKPQHEIMHHTHADGSEHPAANCPVYQTFIDNQPRFIEDDVFWKKDGQKIPVEYSTTPIISQSNETIGSVVVFRDISERKVIEKKTQQYQKDLAHVSRLNTLGGMATGLAHELNQPLTAIATNAFASIQLIESDQIDKSQLVDIMEKINRHAERAGNIIRHLRKLSKKDMPKSSKVNINTLISGVLNLLKPEIKRLNVKVEYDLDIRIRDIYCQAIQIDQVILNLCKNALEVLQQNDESNRLIKITTTIGERKSVLVSVEDNGEGLTEKVASELFEPFVTSKPDGMGLGLSISKNIIEAHEGTLSLVRNDQSKKTIFTFELPQNRE